MSGTFVLSQGGKLVAVIRGANAPLLQKTILDQLEAERKVLAEGGERKVVRRSLVQTANSRVCSRPAIPSPSPLIFPELSAGSFIKCPPGPSPRVQGRALCPP